MINSWPPWQRPEEQMCSWSGSAVDDRVNITWQEVEEDRQIQETHTFDSWEVNAGVLMNPDAIANDPERAFLERTRACDQLRVTEKQKI